jgi:NAD(P)-dependent dehydrogenase (short-subunit alcohol dehydrogenase family)
VDLGLGGKVAIVTGAGSQSGFGRGIALRLAAEGCDVLVSDIHLGGAELTAGAVRELGRRALAVKTDVTSGDEVKRMVDLCLGEFLKIDILVNNAGVGTPRKPFLESTEAEWDRSLDTNLRGTMYCSQAVLPHMLARGQGKIITMASVAGVISVPLGSVYGATKAAIINFTGGLALEVADSGINVNCIAPGLGNTDFLASAGGFSDEYIAHAAELDAAGKTITPEDIGSLVAFLVSDVSRHIVGQCIRISGMT